ncbi:MULTISPECIES: hypothetical protein [Arthrobacter]|uniref:Uncharacterized protein n=1 Tax=Arthrobacter terricola TaxID=2547396 RepID=A0A4R5K937_9MICC|nr:MULTISPECIES: hypothetical protein [Arthrobacter]MBT8162939.1 hypothetical protein [Arthrobacter sp. GN70]TDF91651.1 hypothetical protein E1809_20235 [Arthrobacter terricola]
MFETATTVPDALFDADRAARSDDPDDTPGRSDWIIAGTTVVHSPSSERYGPVRDAGRRK